MVDSGFGRGRGWGWWGGGGTKCVRSSQLGGGGNAISSSIGSVARG